MTGEELRVELRAIRDRLQAIQNGDSWDPKVARALADARIMIIGALRVVRQVSGE
jgi:hypothetical protein